MYDLDSIVVTSICDSVPPDHHGINCTVCVTSHVHIKRVEIMSSIGSSGHVGDTRPGQTHKKPKEEFT